MTDNKETILWESIQDTQRKILALTEYKEKRYLQLRQMWRKTEEIGDDSTWKFSKKVISFDFEDAQLLIEAIKNKEETILSYLES